MKHKILVLVAADPLDQAKAFLSLGVKPQITVKSFATQDDFLTPEQFAKLLHHGTWHPQGVLLFTHLLNGLQSPYAPFPIEQLVYRQGSWWTKEKPVVASEGTEWDTALLDCIERLPAAPAGVIDAVRAYREAEKPA